jgi:cellulose synthase/poly-beta-1,6-N-acetylglucosamine synthase-like glycosyltransferase
MALPLHAAHVFLVFIAIAISLPVAVLSVQIIAALFAKRGVSSPRPGARGDAGAPSGAETHGEAGSLAVVIPAHDEGENLIPTVQDVLSQLGPRGRLIVVADNCSDDTAAIAARAGAEVLVRHDPRRRGKGYALAHAIAELSKAPPDYVAFIDADCRLGPNALRRLQNVCARLRRPAQALYMMTPPPGSPIDHRLAEFFWRIRNYARPLGMRALGLPTQLMGTGMMFPWDVIAAAPLASGDIVEDLNLGIDLARAGHAAIFYPGATVTSFFPSSEKGAGAQRERWIAGHLQTIRRRAPLLWKAAKARNKHLLALILDVLVPPLSLLCLLWLSILLISAAFAALTGLTAAFIISAGSIAALAAAVFAAWLAFGRDIFSAGEISRAITKNLAARVKIYIDFARGRIGSAWVRTDRNKH